MNTELTAQNRPNSSRQLWRGILAATSVALVGATALPAAQAEAAGVKSSSYAVVSPANQPSAVSPSALPTTSDRYVSYRVSADGNLINA